MMNGLLPGLEFVYYSTYAPYYILLSEHSSEFLILQGTTTTPILIDLWMLLYVVWGFCFDSDLPETDPLLFNSWRMTEQFFYSTVLKLIWNNGTCWGFERSKCFTVRLNWKKILLQNLRYTYIYDKSLNELILKAFLWACKN